MPRGALPTQGSCKPSVIPPSQIAHTSNPAGALSCCDSLLWRLSQLPSLTAFLLLPHPATPSRLGTAHYDITWLSPSPEEVRKSSSLPTPAFSSLKSLKRTQFPRVRRAPGDLLGQHPHFDGEVEVSRGQVTHQDDAKGQWQAWPGNPRVEVK